MTIGQRMKDIIYKTNFYKIYSEYKNIIEKGRKFDEEHRKIQYLLECFDIKDMKPAKGFQRKKQISVINFLEKVFTEIEDLNIHPFLIGGGLIGWLRHGGFIPWDSQLSFGILRKELNKLIDYASINWLVLKYEDKEDNQQFWIDEVTHKYAGQYVLFIFPTHVQIAKGTSCIDRIAIDFFVYDFYKENLKFEYHNNYVKKVCKELAKCKNSQEWTELVRTAIEHEDAVVDQSKYLYFGMDSRETYLRMFNSAWIDYETIFPTQKIIYEGTCIEIPNKPEIFIKYEYPNFKELPDDFGCEAYDSWKNYKKENLVCVEFYLVDTFEVDHFLPLYDYLRKKGVYAIFVAEPPEINVSKTWFDYQKAVEVLTYYEVEFETVCNPNADYAFTTQRVDCLRKYKNKKINIVYGCGLPKGQFAFMKDSIEGFDYKFVHGVFTKELCRRNLSEKDWNKYKKNIFLMGYPKYTAYQTEYHSTDIIKELGIKTDKPIICYLPTWGEHACIEEFYEAINSLREKYYVITKPHHCTIRLDSEKDNLQKLIKSSDLIIPTGYNTGKLLSISELVICNAESGVSLECSWLRKDIKAIYITKEQNIEEAYWPEINEVAKVINSPNNFLAEVEDTIIFDRYVKNRQDFVESVFGDNTDYLSHIYDNIFARGDK